MRAVVFEDAAAIIGIGIPASALATHQATGSSVPDSIGAITIGLLLRATAIVLVNRNRKVLIRQMADPSIRDAVPQVLPADTEVGGATYLRLDFVGLRTLFVVGDNTTVPMSARW